MRKITLLALAAFVALTTPMVLNDAYGSVPFTGINAVVTDVVREQGTFVDKWTFTILVTNSGTDTILFDIGYLYVSEEDSDAVYNDCHVDDWKRLRSGAQKTFEACYHLDKDAEPWFLGLYGYRATDPEFADQRQTEIVFDSIAYDYWNFPNPLPTQRISHIIEDIESETMTCEIPPTTITTPTPTPTTESLFTTSGIFYGSHLNIVTFNLGEAFTLIDGWQDHAMFVGMSNDDTIQHILSNTTHNVIDIPSNNAWLDLAFKDYHALRGATDASLVLGVGTVDTDGTRNDKPITIPLTLIP